MHQDPLLVWRAGTRSSRYPIFTQQLKNKFTKYISNPLRLSRLTGGFSTQWMISDEERTVIVRKSHYSDVMKSATASQITSLTIVNSTVYPGADQRKHQCSASLAFVRVIRQWTMNPPHKRARNAKKFSYLMTSSWNNMIRSRSSLQFPVCWWMRTHILLFVVWYNWYHDIGTVESAW